MLFLDDVRRADHDVFTGRAHQHAVVKAVHKNVVGALARRTGHRRQFHRTGQPQRANADHVRQAFQAAVQRIAEQLAHLAGAFKQVFFLEQIKRGDGGSAGHRVARIGVAVEKFDRVLGAVGVGLHHGVKNAVGADHATQWNHAVGHAFGKVQHVGHHAVVVGAKVAAQATKAGDDLVKNQQDAVLVANFP